MPIEFRFDRHPANPIITPGPPDWRMAAAFNPGVIYENGLFTLYERAAGQFRPFFCSIGMLESEDGVHFKQVSDQPVLTPEMLGSKYGSVQDPHVVKIDELYYMTYAYRPFAWSSHPTGVGVPESHESHFPGVERAAQSTGAGSANVQGALPDNNTRSGIAISKDRFNWRPLDWMTPPEMDDRDVILFPEKINGQFAILRRPLRYPGPDGQLLNPSIWISYSEDLSNWTEMELVAKAEFSWEDNRIGGSTPPIKTAAGWLVIYHGVETENAHIKRVCYRVGAMLLDLDNPAKVIARAPMPIMEPETYYERFGSYIPNVIFPTANVVVDGVIYLYYGVCDTAIALATAKLDDLVEYVSRFPVT